MNFKGFGESETMINYVSVFAIIVEVFFILLIINSQFMIQAMMVQLSDSYAGLLALSMVQQSWMNLVIFTALLVADLLLFRILYKIK